jgi:hypothetical protein
MLVSIANTNAPPYSINKTAPSVKKFFFKAALENLNSRQAIAILSNVLPQQLQSNGTIPSRERRVTAELKADKEGICHLCGKWHGVPC